MAAEFTASRVEGEAGIAEADSTVAAVETIPETVAAASWRGGDDRGWDGGGSHRGRDFHDGPGGSVEGYRSGYGQSGRVDGGAVYHGYGRYGYGGVGGYSGPFAVGAILGDYEGRPYYRYHHHPLALEPAPGSRGPAYSRAC